MNPYDKIEEYLRGELNSDERAIVENEMKSDPEFRILVNNYEGVKSLSEGMLEVQLLDAIKKIDGGSADISIYKNFKYWFWIIAIIAVGIISYMIHDYYQEQQRQKIWIAHYQRPDNRDIVRSADPATLDLLAQGKYYFELNKFEESETSLMSLLGLSNNPDTLSEAYYWLGHVMLNLDEFTSAMDNFNSSRHANADYFISLSKVLAGSEDESILNNIELEN